MFSNLKTTLAGVGVLLVTLGNAASQYSSGGFAAINFSVLMAGIATAVGFFLAKDAPPAPPAPPA